MAGIADRIFPELVKERARRAPVQGFPQLPEIPGGRYTRQDFFDLELEHVFRKSWLLAGHVEALPAQGSYFTFNKIPRAPIIIVRGLDNQIRAFYNTCRHRGAPVVKDAEGRCNVLRCQYHSWAYDFDGTLVQVPDEHEFPGLDRSSRGLIPVRCEIFGGLIFVNENSPAPSLRAWMGSLADEWSMLDLDQRRIDFRWSRIVNCNWKCAVDAFQEVYHINTLHPRSVGLALDHAAAVMSLLPGGNSRMCVQLKSSDISKPATGEWNESDLYRLTSVAHTLWPGLIVPWQTGGAKLITFWPRAANQCEISVLGLGTHWGEGPLPPDREAANVAFDGIMMEDMLNLEGIQASLESGAFTGMMLGHQERRIYWFHEQLDRMIGAERLPSGLGVKPLLSRFVETGGNKQRSGELSA
jgi:phenylpropionate dioxygenase-like ring-hydroxylating dioxygenase large terminal subunit